MTEPVGPAPGYDLTGHAALVTGAGSEHGIGFAAAQRLADLGAGVMLAATSAALRAEPTLGDLGGIGLLQVPTARMFDAGKPVSAVCHGPAGLLEARLADGTPLLQGRKATGFSWKEEEGVGRDDAVPFNLEQAMKDRGADYTKALMQQSKKVVTDGHLVTGQNPASARGVGDEVVQLLQAAREAAA